MNYWQCPAGYDLMCNLLKWCCLVHPQKYLVEFHHHQRMILRIAVHTYDLALPK